MSNNADASDSSLLLAFLPFRKQIFAYFYQLHFLFWLFFWSSKKEEYLWRDCLQDLSNSLVTGMSWILHSMCFSPSWTVLIALRVYFHFTGKNFFVLCLIAEDDVDEFLEDGYEDDDEFPPEAEGNNKRNQIMRSLPWTLNVYWKELLNELLRVNILF